MQYFRKIGSSLITICALAGAVPVFAAGTDAGSSVVNSVSLEFTVGGGLPMLETANATFVVDRKLALNVTATDTNYVSILPGQEFTGATGVPALNFTVQNTGNDDTSVLLGLIDQNGVAVGAFAGPPTGAGPFPTFDEDAILVAIDDNGNGVYDEGADTVLPLVNGVYDLDAGMGGQLAEDAVVTVLVVADVPAAAVADEIATYSLVATHYTGAQVAVAGDDNGINAPGFTGATDVADDPSTVQVVFADVGPFETEDLVFDFATPAAGTTTDVASNGQDSDTSSYIIAAVEVLLVKTSQTVFDPVSGEQFYDTAGALSGDFPKAIPGAVVMYVIAAKNPEALGAATAALGFLRDNVPTPSVLVGNPAGVPINLPASLTIDVDPTATVDNVTFTLPGSVDNNQVVVVNCAGIISTQAFTADPNEIDIAPADLGSCAPQESAFVLYFVTINDA